LRGCFRPAPGHVFAAGDFNAIEARVVLALAGQYEVADSFDAAKNGPKDPYIMAGNKVGRNRDTGKAIFLGCGFGLGGKGYKNKIAPNEPMEFCELAVQTYRKELAPLVPKLWYGLDKASADAVWCNAKRRYEFRGISYQMRDEFLVCTLPSGREIYYYQPRREQKVAPWDETIILPAWSFLSFQGKQMRRKTMWHGLATENVVQATARDIMIEAMFRAESAGLPMVFTVYDELVTEPPASYKDADVVLKQCMEERSAWVSEYQIPIRAECEILHEYQK
jgi:DNA polymerase